MKRKNMELENENLNDITSGLDGGQKIISGNAGEDPESLNEFDNAVAGTVKGHGKKKREVALVYDRYYEKTPGTLLILGAKVLFCCALCVCSMMFLLNNFDMPIDLRMAGIVCFCCTAVFSTLFIFARKSAVIPAAVLICSVIVWHNRESLSEKLSWFLDAMILQLDGRLLKTTELITNKGLHVEGSGSLINSFYADKLVFGIVILCILYSMAVSAFMFRKPHFIPLIIVYLIMWAPRMIAERMLFNWWLIPTVALFAGALAMTISNRDGLAIRQGFAHSYRSIAVRNERLFNMRTENSAYLRRTSLRGAYNSKYFSLAMCSVALFLAAILSANAIAGDSRGLDYTELYKFVIELFHSDTGIRSPFTTGPVADYFASKGDGDFRQGAGLSITSPGNGEQDIMLVKNLGTLPIYLRGDIGMELDGDDWTSPIGGVPPQWEENGLNETFAPNELPQLFSVQGMGNYIETEELSIDYLCDTDVVFTPAYIDYYDSYLGDERFTVHGDFAIRTTEKAGKLGSVRGYAYTPVYLGIEGTEWENVSDAVRAAVNSAEYEMTVTYSSYIDMSPDYPTGSYAEKYSDYVYGTYMGVPDHLREPIAQFIIDNLMEISEVSDISLYGAEDTETRYRAALAIANYLRENYTYELNAPINKGDPVMSFLNDVKRGHCALYASSMTMIMRKLGIPARYCTGFIAPPTNEAGRVLHSKNLHAWCEVYLDELGWVTFDPTSSAAIDMILNGGPSDIPEYSRPELSGSYEDTETDETTEETDEESDSSGTVVADEKPNIMPYLMTVLGIAAGIALIIFIIFRIRRFDRNAKKALKRFYTADDMQSVYSRLLAVLRLCGIIPNGGELTGDFFKRAGKELGCAVYKHKELLEKIAFGSGDISDVEKAEVAGLLEKIFAAANKKLGIIGKFRLRRIMTSKKRF